MRSRSNIDDEFWVLTTEPGRALLEQVNVVSNPKPADLARWRKAASFSQVSAAIQIAETRRRGTAKFRRAAKMWFDAVGLEQSTSEEVARHKARRFADRLVYDLCCGIGGDALALGSVARVVAVDLEPGLCRRAAWNAEVYDVSETVEVRQGDAESLEIPSDALVHVDPDRRSTSDKKTNALIDYQPGLEFLKSLSKVSPGGAIKLGPASDFDAHFAEAAFEVELISLRGECKEATAWHGGLATCRRRATVLPAGATWTDRDAPLDSHAGISPIQSWIFDADPSLARSGLLDGFAKAQGLTRFVGGIDFLTSDVHVRSPFLSAFEAIEILPMDRKVLKKEMTSRSIGVLEIKTKGVDIRPETLRGELHLEGPNEATLLIAGGEGATTVILARRVRD